MRPTPFFWPEFAGHTPSLLILLLLRSTVPLFVNYVPFFYYFPTKRWRAGPRVPRVLVYYKDKPSRARRALAGWRIHFLTAKYSRFADTYPNLPRRHNSERSSDGRFDSGRGQTATHVSQQTALLSIASFRKEQYKLCGSSSSSSETKVMM